MEEYIKNRDDITEKTKKVYLSFIKNYHKYNDKDPKEDTKETILKTLNKLSLIAKQKVIGVLSKYLNDPGYGELIRPLQIELAVSQNEKTKALKKDFKYIELYKKIDKIKDKQMKFIFNILLDFPEMRNSNYSTLYDLEFDDIENLPKRYNIFKDKAVGFKRNIDSFIVSFNNTNNKLGIPRGLNFWKHLNIEGEGEFIAER